MNLIGSIKEMMRKRHHEINLNYLAAAIPAMLLCLSACDGSGGLGKSENCICPKPTVKLRTEAIENVTGSGIAGYAADGDMDTVRYIIDHLKDDAKNGIPLPQWNSALEAAIQSGHVKIAEVLIKEMAKLPEEHRTLSKRDWDQLVYCVADSGKNCCKTCDAMRFIFRHAKHIINNPLEQISKMSDCKLQACIDYGFLNDSFKNGNKALIADVVNGASIRMKTRTCLDNNNQEKVLFNKKITEEAFVMVKRLLAHGYRPSPNDIAFLKGNYTEGAEAKEMRKKVLKLLDKYK